MAAAPSSYFAGPAIMPSQRAAAAPDNSVAASSTPSPAKYRDPRFAGCAPVTVRHIARSFAAAAAAAGAAGGGDPVVSIDGVEATNVWVVGRVVDMVSMEAGVSFTLDDGTGKIPLVRWISDHIDAKEAAFVQNGKYLKVQVTLVGFQAKQQGFARSISEESSIFGLLTISMKWCFISLSVYMCTWKMSGQRCKVNSPVLFHQMHLLMRCEVQFLTRFKLMHLLIHIFLVE